MKVKPTSEIVEFLRPIAEEIGVEIVEAAWDNRTRSLTIYLDKEGGLDVLTCEKFHRAIDLPLDELDPTFGESYTLNCSSLGLDRPFKTERDFLRHMGEKVEVHLYAPIHGKKEHDGVLTAYDGSVVTIESDGKTLEFPKEKCAKVCLFIEV